MLKAKNNKKRSLQKSITDYWKVYSDTNISPLL